MKRSEMITIMCNEYHLLKRGGNSEMSDQELLAELCTKYDIKWVVCDPNLQIELDA